jgi:2-dehydro-3-deoxyphosphooctonate aldolase (KDO 8-P synthase)
MPRLCRVANLSIGAGHPLVIIAGPCVLESLELGMQVGRHLRTLCRELGLGYIFKASFDKANRSSMYSPRGPGLERGLDWLSAIGADLAIPLTTDIHEPGHAEAAARVVDLLQIPAFLCRQTDLLIAAGQAAARHSRAVNVKKGQFMSPAEMAGPMCKLAEAGCTQAMVTDRGTFFGYGRLVNDFVGLGDLLELEATTKPRTVNGRDIAPVTLRAAVCLDCTHSTQLPGSGEQTGGRPERAPLLARAAAAAGVDALFIECHPEPSKCLSDASTMLPLGDLAAVLRQVAAVRAAIEA